MNGISPCAFMISLPCNQEHAKEYEKCFRDTRKVHGITHHELSGQQRRNKSQSCERTGEAHVNLNLIDGLDCIALCDHFRRHV